MPEDPAPGTAPLADPVRRLDVRGHHCPIPVLKARKALAAMIPGARLEVLASDPAARIDMAHFCETAGHRLLACREDADGLCFLIERG